MLQLPCEYESRSRLTDAFIFIMQCSWIRKTESHTHTHTHADQLSSKTVWTWAYNSRSGNAGRHKLTEQKPAIRQARNDSQRTRRKVIQYLTNSLTVQERIWVAEKNCVLLIIIQSLFVTEKWKQTLIWQLKLWKKLFAAAGLTGIKATIAWQL